MNWHSKRGRIRLMLTALLTALAVCLPAGAALASPPNESSLWTAEMTANGMVQTPNAPAEAYNGSNLMEVWRGDNNHIYLSLNHGPDIEFGTNTLGITNTLAAPRVVTYGPNNWAVFHTGVDGQIYWMELDLAVVQAAATQGYIVPVWNALPDTTTVPNLSPDVATAGPGSYTMLVTYRSSTNDNQLYSQWFGGYNVGTDGWLSPEAIPGAFSASTPAIVWNQALNFFVLFFRGTDNGLYYTDQNYGGPWSPVMGIDHTPNIGSGPSVMALSNGDMQIAMRDVYGSLWYIQYYTATSSFTLPTQDSTHTNIDTPPQLVGTQGNSIWTLVSYLGYAYWKLSMKENSLPSNHLTTGDVSAERAAFERAGTSAATS